MYNFIYAMPLDLVIVIIFMGILLWPLAIVFSKRKFPAKSVQRSCCILAAVSLGLILFFTLGIHKVRVYALELQPFYSFQKAKLQPEIYRSMLMNVFLFVPLGLTLPFSLPERTKHKILWTAAVAFVLSACVEGIQYFFSLGNCETDDVITNTLGAVLGALSYRVYGAWEKRIPKK